jgi:hypothetical protein
MVVHNIISQSAFPVIPIDLLAGQQILSYCEPWKDLPPLWNVSHAFRTSPSSWQVRDLNAPESNEAGGRRYDANYRLEKCCFANTVPPDDCYDFAREQPKGDPLQYVAAAISCADIGDCESLDHLRLSEVDPANFLMRFYFSDATLCEDLALMHYRDPLSNLPNKLHIVFDDQYG